MQSGVRVEENQKENRIKRNRREKMKKREKGNRRDSGRGGLGEEREREVSSLFPSMNQ